VENYRDKEHFLEPRLSLDYQFCSEGSRIKVG